MKTFFTENMSNVRMAKQNEFVLLGNKRIANNCLIVLRKHYIGQWQGFTVTITK